jgi:hypothetical protein
LIRKPSRPLAFALAFAALTLFWRGLFWPVSQGCYTDGILQVDCFRLGLSYWPPLYALMTRLLVWIPGLDLESAGRLVALLAGVLVVFPLAAAARRLFGLRAALWAMACWLVSPIAHRWSLQVMTDMPMTVLWTSSLASLLLALESYLPGMFPHDEMNATPAPDPRQGFQWLLLASMLGALATLTRFQGILLLPPLALAAFGLRRLGRASGAPAAHPLWTLAVWLIVPVWLFRQGLGPLAAHFQQIGDRAGGNLARTLVQVYWFQFEDFWLWLPYFLTYGLFGFMVYALFRTRWATARIRWTAWVTLYLAVAIIGLQSVFSSFQSRYLLPLVPLVCLFAGHGLAIWERHQEKTKWRFWILAGPALAYALAMSLMVAAWQGNPFKDIKDAARFAAREMNLPEQAAIHSNEVYNAKIGCAKAAFWSGRPVKLLGADGLRPGDAILLSSCYGGLARYRREIESLKTQPVRVVKRFGRYAVPLLPDIMEEPFSHQNPLALALRYRPQYFETAVLEVTGPATSATQTLDMGAPQLPQHSRQFEQLLDEAKDLRQQLQTPQP